jgi:hypothetical protein
LASSRIQINIQKSVVNNEQNEKEIRETIPFIIVSKTGGRSKNIVSKTIKYLVINSTQESKDLFNENYKPLKREMQEDFRRQDHLKDA